MGIIRNSGICYLIENEESYEAYIGKSILMLGKQDVYMTYNEFVDLCNKVHFDLLDGDYTEGHMDSITMFKMMGFSIVHSLDLTDYESADIIFDLNCNELPLYMINSYDYIYDGGTLEHVFNLPTALINTSKMLKVNGIIIHDLPAHNWFDHGFYSISPTLLIDYYNVNNFKIKSIYLLGIHKDKEDVISGDCRYNNCNKFIKDYINDEMIVLVCISQKGQNSSNTKIPTQAFYANLEKNRMYGKYDKEDKMNKLIKLLKQYKDKTVAIYGTGNTTDLIIKECQNDKLYHSLDKIAGIYCRDKKLKGLYSNGIDILNINRIHEDKIEHIVIGSLSRHTEEIYIRLSYLINENINIIKLCDL